MVVKSKKIKEFFQDPDFILLGAIVLFVILLLMIMLFISVVIDAKISVFFHDKLDTNSKHETLTLIGWGIGGVFAATCTVFGIYHRANAQAKNVEARVESNRLTEKDHINKRFRSASENLGHGHAETRIATFYEFYDLAKDQQDDNFRHTIFEILCSYFRSMPRNISHLTEKDGKERPTPECQTLLNILLHPLYHDVFDGFEPNLQRVCLIGTQLWNANLLGANLAGANLSNALLCRADFFCANLTDANLSNADLSDTNFSKANLSGANLWGADLSDANLSEANLSNTNLLGANLTYANFRNSILKDANLTDVKVDEFRLNNTRFPSVDFGQANLINSKFIGAILPRANFRHADFTEHNPEESRDKGVNFEGANLQNADMRNVNFSGTSFKSAKLKLAQFDKYSSLSFLSSIDNADFNEATVDGEPITKNHLPTGRGTAKL